MLDAVQHGNMDFETRVERIDPASTRGSLLRAPRSSFPHRGLSGLSICGLSRSADPGSRSEVGTQSSNRLSDERFALDRAFERTLHALDKSRAILGVGVPERGHRFRIGLNQIQGPRFRIVGKALPAAFA